MANDDLLRRIEDLEAKKEHLSKKIACISGAKASKLTKELDRVDHEIARIKEAMEKGGSVGRPSDAEHDAASKLNGQVKYLDSMHRRINRYFTIWIFVVLILVGLFLFATFLYLRGLLASPKEAGPIGNNEVYAIVTYPSALQLNKGTEIMCDVTRKSSDYHGRILAEFLPKDGFRFKDNHHLFDFSAIQSPLSLPWATQVTYKANRSWIELLSNLIFSKHIDVVLRNEQGKEFAQECISFQIISFYSQLARLILAISTMVAAILTGRSKLGRFLKEAIGQVLAHTQ